MAKRDTSFSMQLSDIPVPGNTGEAMGFISQSGQSQAAAGRSAGAAEAMGTQLTTGAIGTVFDAARGAYIGVESAIIERKAEKAIAKFEDSPENVAGRKAYEAVEAAKAKGVPLPPEVVALQEKAAKYKQAMDQGFINQEEAINRMAAAVKAASARSPGLQSEFRKVAANVSGINAVDIYLDHKALTTESDRAKAEAARLKSEQKYIDTVAGYFGIPPSQVTRHHAERYAASQALKNDAANAEAALKIKTINDEQRGEAFTRATRAYVADDMNHLSVDLAEWNRLNQDLSPEAAKQKDALRASMAVKVEQLKLQRKKQLSKLANEGSIPSKVLQEQIKTIDDHYGQVVKMISDDKFDLLKNTLGRSEDGVKMMESKFAQAFPIFTMMRKAGISETLMSNLFTPAGMANVNNIMGKGFAEGVRGSLKDLPGWAERQVSHYNDEAFDRDGPVDLGSQRAPAEAKAVDMKTALTNVGMLGTKPVSKWDDEDRNSAKKYAGTLGKTLESQILVNPNNAEYMLGIVEKSAPRLMEGMTEDQRKLVGNQFQRTGEGHLKQQLPEIKNDLDNLRRNATMKHVDWEIVPKAGGGVELKITGRTGLQPTDVRYKDGTVETKMMVPLKPNDAAKATMAQVERSLNKINLALRSVALGNRMYGGGMDIDTATGNVIGALQHGAPLAALTPQTAAITQPEVPQAGK